MRRFSLLISFAFVVVSFVPETQAQRRGIPIFWGKGEQLIEVGELPPEIATEASTELGHRVKVGYYYESFQIFFLDVWTWNGKHVLCANDDRYWELPPEGWREALGADVGDQYSVPIRYRIPFFPVVVAVGAAIFLGFKYGFQSRNRKLEALSKDTHYRRAFSTVIDVEGDDKLITTVVDETKFNDAKNHLISLGIQPRKAEKNLRLMVDVYLDGMNERIDQSLTMANQLDHEGEWAASADIYTKIVECLSDKDERLAYARNCLAEVQSKLENDNGTESTDKSSHLAES